MRARLNRYQQWPAKPSKMVPRGDRADGARVKYTWCILMLIRLGEQTCSPMHTPRHLEHLRLERAPPGTLHRWRHQYCLPILTPSASSFRSRQRDQPHKLDKCGNLVSLVRSYCVQGFVLSCRVHAPAGDAASFVGSRNAAVAPCTCDVGRQQYRSCARHDAVFLAHGALEGADRHDKVSCHEEGCAI